MSGPGLSVIIPTLNEKENISRLLDRLKIQMKRGDEAIVVDGFSSDGTGSVARQLGARVLLQKPTGIGAAKTRGAMSARNNILVFLDADCILPKDYLERIRRHFASNHVDMVGGLVLHGSLLYDVFAVGVYCLGRLIHVLTGKSWVPPNNCAYKKDTFLGAGGFRSVVAEDTDLLRRLPRSTKVTYDRSMTILLSPRRFKEKGFLSTILLWGVADLHVMLNRPQDAKGYRSTDSEETPATR